MKKIISLLLTVVLLTASVFTVVASADFGTGVSVLATETKVIKSGLYGRKLTFSENDFKQALCIDSFKSITVTKLPKSSEGTLLLAGRRLSEGSTVKRKNLASLVFIPASKDVTECKFYFTIDSLADGEEIEFLIRFTDKINYEPKTDGATEKSLSQKTQRDIGISAKMYAEDPEGDTLEYIIVSYPENGTLTLIDKNNGDYRYTPHTVYTGKDSFVYVVRDEWGNWSTPSTVTISVSERMSEVIYKDMEGYNEYNDAVTLTAMGIMGGTLVGNNMYFNPDDTVSRAEFLCMAMKSVGMYAKDSGVATYFDDNSEIPTPLLPYVKLAQDMGIVNGEFKNGRLLFRPNDTVTKYEASVMMARLLGEKDTEASVTFTDANDIPVWARADVALVYSLGIFDGENGGAMPHSTLSRRECAECLVRLSEEKNK